MANEKLFITAYKLKSGTLGQGEVESHGLLFLEHNPLT